MRITFDPAKRKTTLAERGLDIADAALVFAGVTVEIEDARKNYGENRFICYGLLQVRMDVVGLHTAWRGSPHLQHEESQ